MTGAPFGIVGNMNLDLWVAGVTRFPQRDEEVLATSSSIELAGTAGYVLQAALALGVEPRVVSTIGDDRLGDMLLAELGKIGCPVDGLEVVAGDETSLGIVFVREDGSRSILTTLGAHAVMDPAVARGRDAWIAPCAEVLLCGSYLLPRFGPDEILPYAAELRRRGQVVAFDPSWDPAGWPPATREATLRLLRAVDVYLPNDAELMALTGTADLEAAVAAVAAVAGEVELVVKRGADGALFARGGERVSEPGYPIRAVNTIGAGDIFDTAYLLARRRGMDVSRRLRFANAAAALAVRQEGARVYPGEREIEEAMRDWATDTPGAEG